MNRLLYQDEARLEYGRRFWRAPERKARLLAHWLDARHPYRDRFVERWQPLVDRVLSSPAGSDDALDAALQSEGLSLRVVVKEIPPVFGSFWGQTGSRAIRGGS
jgi:hypothetical protein